MEAGPSPTKAHGSQQRPGFGGRQARRRRGRPVHGKVEADAAARGAVALGADAHLIRIVEEGEAVRAQGGGSTSTSVIVPRRPPPYVASAAPAAGCTLPARARRTIQSWLRMRSASQSTSSSWRPPRTTRRRVATAPPAGREDRPPAKRTEGGRPAALCGTMAGVCVASARLRKQCDSPESSRHLTRVPRVKPALDPSPPSQAGT